MYEVYALKYAERDVAACNFLYREASHAPVTLHDYVWRPVHIITNLPEMYAAFETIDALAGTERLVGTGHDPQVARPVQADGARRHPDRVRGAAR